MASGLFNGLNFSKIVSGVNNTVSVINKAIPVYKQVSPVIKNVRSAFSTVSSLKKSSDELKREELKKYERPETIFKKQNDNRGNINLDTLTFFQ